MASFLDTRIGDIVKDQSLVVLQPDFSVKDALGVFATNNISSAPIVQDKKLLGFVDVLDILAHLIRVASQPLSSFYQELSRNLSTDDMEFLYQRTQHFNLVGILNINNLSRLNPTYVLQPDTPLKEALRIMKERVHRIGVVSENGELIGVLTQSDIIHRFGGQMGPKLDKPVGHMTSLTEKVVAIPAMTTAIDAFIRMHKRKLSALAIIDEDGKLVGNLSASDLKGLVNFPFPRLLELLPDFLRTIRNQNEKSVDYLISVRESDTLKEAWQRMCKDHVHRVYVVDNNNKPIGVASMQDLIQEMVLEFQGSSE
jgi:CBS domain-containing protein